VAFNVLISPVIYEFDCGFFILKFIVSKLRLKLKVNSMAIIYDVNGK